MNNTEVLNEFFVWEEKNSTDHNQNLLKNAEQDNSVTTIETKTDSIPKDWRDITNPKLRKKMRKKAYYEKNKDKLKIKQKVWIKNNKDKIKIRQKNYNEVNKDKIKAYNKIYQDVNKEKLKLAHKVYREANKDKVKVQTKVWREANKDKVKVQTKNYREANKDKINKWFVNKFKTNVQFKLSRILRNRLRSALKDNQKSGNAVRDLGCSIDEFKSYIESKFQSGMSWDNYGLYGWHLDHIKPLSSFDLTDRKQMLEACHYTNLQPLWAKDNLIKSDKILNN